MIDYFIDVTNDEIIRLGNTLVCPELKNALVLEVEKEFDTEIKSIFGKLNGK